LNGDNAAIAVAAYTSASNFSAAPVSVCIPAGECLVLTVTHADPSQFTVTLKGSNGGTASVLDAAQFQTDLYFPHGKTVVSSALISSPGATAAAANANGTAANDACAAPTCPTGEALFELDLWSGHGKMDWALYNASTVVLSRRLIVECQRQSSFQSETEWRFAVRQCLPVEGCYQLGAVEEYSFSEADEPWKRPTMNLTFDGADVVRGAFGSAQFGTACPVCAGVVAEMVAWNPRTLVFQNNSIPMQYSLQKSTAGTAGADASTAAVVFQDVVKPADSSTDCFEFALSGPQDSTLPFLLQYELSLGSTLIQRRTDSVFAQDLVLLGQCTVANCLPYQNTGENLALFQVQIDLGADEQVGALYPFWTLTDGRDKILIRETDHVDGRIATSGPKNVSVHECISRDQCPDFAIVPHSIKSGASTYRDSIDNVVLASGPLCPGGKCPAAAASSKSTNGGGSVKPIKVPIFDSCSKSNLSGGAIAGIVIGSHAGAALIGAVTYKFFASDAAGAAAAQSGTKADPAAAAAPASTAAVEEATGHEDTGNEEDGEAAARP
jgi:hypothetical protein